MSDDLRIQVLKDYFPQVIQAVDSHSLLNQHIRRQSEPLTGQNHSWILPITQHFRWGLEIWCELCTHPDDFGIHYWHNLTSPWENNCDQCWEGYDAYSCFDEWGKIVLEDPRLDLQVDRIIRSIVPTLQQFRADLNQGLSILQFIEETNETTNQTNQTR